MVFKLRHTPTIEVRNWILNVNIHRLLTYMYGYFFFVKFATRKLTIYRDSAASGDLAPKLHQDE